MAHIYDLHDDMLITILLLLVTSSYGAVDLARLSTTCKKFMSLSKESIILKVVKFDKIRLCDYKYHHHAKDLLVLCARAGNIAAESRLGKELLCKDPFFWSIIWKHDEPLLFANPQASGNGILRHEKLVRTFIRYAGDEELAVMRTPLFNYIRRFLGRTEVCRSGILLAITNMCCHYLNIIKCSFPRNYGSIYFVQENENVEIKLHRATALAIYDKMFPLSHE